MPQLKLITPSEVLQPGEAGLPDFAAFKYKFLAQGDSWFSIGAFPPTATTNLLLEMRLQAKACAVNCAFPGFALQRMIDRIRDPDFCRLLVGPQSWAWDGILMSTGGNDLIDALQVMPRFGKGHPLEDLPIPPELRLLLRPDEWTPGASADRYLSDEGWATFSAHMAMLFGELQKLRDDAKSQSAGVPLFVHCYDCLLARDAPAGLGKGPWLLPALQAYSIPEADWKALGEELVRRFRQLLLAIDMPNLHVVDDTPGTLTPALGTAHGASNDWQNEIHPTARGYAKLAAKYAARVDAIFV